MATANRNRVIVRKGFSIPATFAKKLPGAKLPTAVYNSQTYQFDLQHESLEDGTTTIVKSTIIGTIANVYILNSPNSDEDAIDVLVKLTPVWQPTGPAYPVAAVSLGQVAAMTQMYVTFVQDKTPITNLPIDATRFRFTINGCDVEADSLHFQKVVYRKASGETDGVYGYLTDIAYTAEGTTLICMNCIALNDGIASYSKERIDLDEVIGIYRYGASTELLVPRYLRSYKTDADGDILPDGAVSTDTSSFTGKSAKATKSARPIKATSENTDQGSKVSANNAETPAPVTEE